MTANLTKKGGRASATCLLGQTGSRRTTPRVVLAGPALTDTIAGRLRALGWNVCVAATVGEAAILARATNPTAVVLPAEADDGESGYLVCAKLRRARPRLKLVLVAEAQTPRDVRLARFVGATLATGATAADEVAKLV
jgi:hypothetical protein